MNSAGGMTMARFLLGILLGWWLFSLPASAQLIRTAGAKIGAVSATQNWSYALSPGGIGEESRWGLDIGGYIEWFQHPILSLSTEFHYVEKGMQTRVAITTETAPDGTGQFIIQKARVMYFSFPLLLKARAELGGVTVYGLAGPRFDLLLGNSGSDFLAVLDNFRKHEIGATFGVGGEVQLHPAVALGAEAKYSLALRPAYETDLLKVHNRSWEFLIVIGF